MKQLATLLLLLSLTASVNAKNNLTPQQRANKIISQLTLEEKAKLMTNVSGAIPRLGIPEFQWWNEALHGVGRNGNATVFPITMGMAASWDDALLYRCFDAVSDEARIKNQQAKRSGEVRQYQSLSFWTPNINIFRDPRWGRGQETYGEDPYLTSRMGLAVVNGLQGPRTAPYRKLLACAKHFAVHSGPEWNRHTFNIENLPERDLWETYLPAFKTLVQEGDVQEVMCAYQRFDGKPCCGNSRLLQQILRDEWGYQGLVVSDCGAISDFFRKGAHGVASSAAEASGMAVSAGTDLNCGESFRSVPEAIKSGRLTEEQVDKSLCRLLSARIMLGDLDADSLVEWTRIPPERLCSREHNDLAYKMAQESMVLLQNRDGFLPLRKDGIKVALIGPNACDSTMQWGNYNGFPLHTVTILEGLQKKLAGRGSVTYFAENCQLSLLKDADVVVFVGGISPKLEGEEMNVDEPGFRGGDRTDIQLPQRQRSLVQSIHLLGKKIVFVNCSGSAVALVPETKNCEAILQAWYPGERGGDAVADVLFGDYNPSGKLPVTFYRSVSDLPDFLDYTMQNRTYRYFKGSPLWPFGFGLSYTSFSIGKPSYKNGKLSLSIENIGKMDGSEVVQVYIKRMADTEGPLKSLRAFQRVTLKQGEKQTVNIDIPKKSFESWDQETNTLRNLPGKYQLMVGTSSQDPHMQTLEIEN